MDAEEKALKKLEQRLYRYIKEYKFRRKDIDEREVEEEVFDENTLKTLYELSNEGIIAELYGVVAAGKESRVYGGVTEDGEPIAIKIFLITTAEFRKGRMKYILGDPRFEEVGRSIHKIIYLWAQKEYRNLKAAYEAGVYVPRPIAFKNNILVMEFIGDEFQPAPTLKEYKRITPHMLYQILRQIYLLYNKAELIHTDLSEYNIFYYKRKPIIFDFGQAVSIKHPMAETFLTRDISNILNFFRNRGIDISLTVEDVLEYIKG